MSLNFDYRQIPTESIVIPEWVSREEDRVQDDILRKSIQEGGVHIPLLLLPDGDKFVLVKGSRRLRLAKQCAIPKVPAIVDRIPEGETLDEYGQRIRFILTECRQDLLPSQKAALILQIKRDLGLNNAQVAAHLGVDPDSITNWLAVLKYVPEVVAAMDAGRLTMQRARVFDGMSDKGQFAVWDKHNQELMDGTGATHKELRALYPPAKHPEFYRNPDAIKKRLERKSGKRASKARIPASADEKKRMLNSVEMKEAELAELTSEIKTLQGQCKAAGPVVAAILRNKSLLEFVPEPMQFELKAFSEKY